MSRSKTVLNIHPDVLAAIDRLRQKLAKQLTELLGMKIEVSRGTVINKAVRQMLGLQRRGRPAAVESFAVSLHELQAWGRTGGSAGAATKRRRAKNIRRIKEVDK